MNSPWACKLCKAADVEGRQPTHVVHPISGEVVLFDVFGHAMCIACGAQWRRERNSARIVGRYNEPEREETLARASKIIFTTLGRAR